MIARDRAADESKQSHEIVGSGGYGTLCTNKSRLDCCTKSPHKALVLHAHLPHVHQPHKAGTRRRSDNQYRQSSLMVSELCLCRIELADLACMAAAAL